MNLVVDLISLRDHATRSLDLVGGKLSRPARGGGGGGVGGGGGDSEASVYFLSNKNQQINYQIRKLAFSNVSCQATSLWKHGLQM